MQHSEYGKLSRGLPERREYGHAPPADGEVLPYYCGDSWLKQQVAGATQLKLGIKVIYTIILSPQ